MTKLFVSVVGVMILAILFAVAGMYINAVSDAPCSVMNEQVRKDGEPEYCGSMSWVMKAILIATHLLAYALFPFSMHVFWSSASQLKAQNPFRSILGFSFLMVAITGEIGWHVGQQWFYQEEYHIMNFVFYFFFTLGFACWADGVKFKHSGTRQKGVLDKRSGRADILLFISPLLVTFVYAAGATFKNICPKDVAAGALCSILSTKIPIYLVMCFQLTVLSVRLYKVLGNDWRIVFFPFFSLVVNLTFIFLLNKNVTDSFKNPLYHTLHDLIGTELGVFIVVLLVWSKTSAPEENWGKSE